MGSYPPEGSAANIDQCGRTDSPTGDPEVIYRLSSASKCVAATCYQRPELWCYMLSMANLTEAV